MPWENILCDEDLTEVGIVVCLDDNQRFLIIRRSNIDEREGQWTVPGGHIDDKDLSIEHGAIRELKEETNLTCLIKNLVYLGTPKIKKHYFLTRTWRGEINISMPNPETGKIEHDDYKWSRIEEIKDIDNSEIPIYLLEKALEMSKNE